MTDTRRKARGTSATFAIAALATLGLAVGASPAAAQTSTVTPYTASANGSLVGLSAVTIPNTLNLASAQVAPADAEVNSAGRSLPNVPPTAEKLPNNATAHARATNLDASLLNDNIPLKGLLVSAEQFAPPDNPKPTTNTLLSVPADPLLDATVATATAQARDAQSVCGPNQVISQGESTLATANVLVPTPGQPVVSVDNSTGGPVTTDSTVSLVPVKALTTGLAVQSQVTTQVTSVVLFKGTANEIDINVVSPPTLTIINTGDPKINDASDPTSSIVTATAPVVTITQGGKVTGILDLTGVNQTITIPSLASISLGTLSFNRAADGTINASSALLNVSIGPSSLNIATVTVAGAAASAKVPSGGVVCPTELPTNQVEALKDLTATVVAPGQSFNYTVVVHPVTCDLTNVTVTDTMSYNGAGTPTISATVPPASSAAFPNITWNDVGGSGGIGADDTVYLQITVVAPTNMQNGAQFKNNAVITGTCNGQSYSQNVGVVGPVGFVPQPGTPCRLENSNKASDHLQVFNGESFDYFVHVLSDGATACNNVVVTDTLIPQVSFVSCSDNCTVSGTTLTWNLGTLAPGQSRTLVIEVRAGNATVAPIGTHLPDQAVINATGISPVTVSTPGPEVTGTSVLAPPNPAAPTVLGLQVTSSPPRASTLPVTGGSPMAPWGLAALAAGGGVLAWRRRLAGLTAAKR